MKWDFSHSETHEFEPIDVVASSKHSKFYARAGQSYLPIAITKIKKVDNCKTQRASKTSSMRDIGQRYAFVTRFKGWQSTRSNVFSFFLDAIATESDQGAAASTTLPTSRRSSSSSRMSALCLEGLSARWMMSTLTVCELKVAFQEKMSRRKDPKSPGDFISSLGEGRKSLLRVFIEKRYIPK